jgi:MFS superfamily sulfate permease-like transporter
VLGKLPQATLASLVFVAVLGLIDVPALRRLWGIRRGDFWIAAVTTVVGLTAGLLQAVALGVVLTLILVLRALNQPRVRVTPHGDTAAVLTLLAPLYTANVLGTEQAILASAAELPGLRTLVLDMSVIQETSVTVLDTLTDLDRELAGTGVELRVAALPPGAARVAERTAWFRGLAAAGRVSPTVAAALAGPASAGSGVDPAVSGG